MVNIREIIKYYETGINTGRAIGRILKIDKETVLKIIRIAEKQNIKYEDIKDMHDDTLYKIFYPNNTNIKYQKPEPNIDKIIEELRKNKLMTLKLLWEEYINEHPDGLGYTQFRERIKEKISERDIKLHVERIPGEKMYVDWAGDTTYIFDSATGEEIKVYLFVACIGVSSLAYVEAFLSTKLECFIQGNVSALNYYGGKPKYIVPDNDKSAVIKASKYDPIINPVFLALADHYNIVVFPARTASPKDKATVEKAVHDAGEKIILSLRNIKFFSLADLNKSIQEKLKIFNSTPYQKERNYNRFTKFLEVDRPAMKDLPVDSFEFFHYGVYTVHMDTHIEIKHKCYSVPFKYVGKKVDVRIGASKIVIYYKNELIASHIRIDNGNRRYSTDKSHLPERLQAYLRTNKEQFINWANGISPMVNIVVEEIFNKSVTEEYAYRPCLGLKRLHKVYGPTRFIEACEKAVNANIVSYAHIKNLLEIKQQPVIEEHIINHDNIRGAKTYDYIGGINE
jgi:transposase